AAESAADIRNVPADPVIRTAEHTAQLAAPAVWILRRDPHRQEVPAGIVRGARPARLDRRRHQARDAELLAHDAGGPRERTVHISLAPPPPREDVVRQ